MRLFVRVDRSGPERFQFDPAHESSPIERLPVEFKLLVIDVDGCFIFGAQHAVLASFLENLGRPIVDGLVADQVIPPVQNQADNIVLVPLVEVVLKVAVDDVVRRGDNRLEGTDAGKIVTKGAKCLDIGHG